ncbi:hypothetical protein LTR17_019368 [Elasticomyces elasticus]|nr:hypothetical protein LTR17_019368 [Elasticomyces elasticus]
MQIPTTSSVINGNRAFWSRVVVPLAVLVGLIIFTATFFTLITAPGQAPNFTCTPNGAVKFPWSTSENDEIMKSYSPTWDPSQVLSITLGVGSFTFTQAKAIDFLWDLIVGRWGQFVLVWCCYPIFRRSLLLEMESHRITLPTFASLAFDKIGWSSVLTLARSSVSGVWHAFRQLDARKAFQIRALRSRSRSPGRLELFLGAFGYILMFPSWMSIMTGYQAQSQPYVLIINGNLIPTTALAQPDAVVIDGSIIGLSDNRVVFQSNESSLFDSLVNYSRALASLASDENTNSTRPGTVQGFQDNSTNPAQWTFTVVYSDFLSYNSSGHDFHCSGVLGDKWRRCWSFVNSSITIYNHTYTFQQPLDVAISNGSHYGDAQDGRGIYIPDAVAYRSYGEEALSTNYLQNHTTCQPSTIYHWGFSSLLLFAFCVTSLVFATTISLLDTESYWHGRTDRLDVPANIYRDALDLSIELRARYGEEVDEMPSTELLDLINQKPSEISLDLTHLPQNRRRMHKQQGDRGTPIQVECEAIAGFPEQAKVSRAGCDTVAQEELEFSDMSSVQN